MLKIEKFTDVCTTGVTCIPPVIQMSVNFSIFNIHFSVDITPEMLKLCRFTKVKVFYLVLVYVFKFDLFKFLAAILEKGLFKLVWRYLTHVLGIEMSPRA